VLEVDLPGGDEIQGCGDAVHQDLSVSQFGGERRRPRILGGGSGSGELIAEDGDDIALPEVFI
jgi:hypothetical protein